jgi:hypothetical protein
MAVPVFDCLQGYWLPECQGERQWKTLGVLGHDRFCWILFLADRVHASGDLSTYEPVLSLGQAKWLSKETGDQNHHAPLEMGGCVSFAERLKKVLRRLVAILMHE